MSLLQEAQDFIRPTGVCGVKSLYERLDPTEQAEFTEALASHVPAAPLSQALARRGHNIGYQTISRHRRGECSCR